MLSKRLGFTTDDSEWRFALCLSDPLSLCFLFFFFQAEDGIRYLIVTGVQTCALPIWLHRENLTAMLALESTFADPAAARAPEEFVADTIVRLSVEPVQRAVLRSLEVEIGRASCRERV